MLARLESMAGEMVAFAQELVAVPTVNPPGENYRACAELIGERLKAFDYEIRYVTAQDLPEHSDRFPRVNVIGELRGTTARPRLHFNGHFDVVPAGDGWTLEPFAGTVLDGKLFGRGASDQKCGIAASIFAVEALRREGLKPAGAIEQSATVDEETGGFAGMAYLAERGFLGRDRTDFVIITEPLNVDRLCLGHRGVYWFEIATLGRIAHGSMPFLGISAIGKMGEFISAIERELRPALQTRTTAMPVEPPEARRPSLNINSIHGGQPLDGFQSPCVADRCTAIFDRRFLIEEPLEQVREEIREILRSLSARDPDFRYEMKDLMTVHPVQTEAKSPLVTAVSRAVLDVLGAEPPLIASPGTYDQKHVMRLGHVEQCIAYGPGLLHLAHQPDEYCRIDHLVQGSKVMALAAMRLVGTQ